MDQDTDLDLGMDQDQDLDLVLESDQELVRVLVMKEVWFQAKVLEALLLNGANHHPVMST